MTLEPFCDGCFDEEDEPEDTGNVVAMNKLRLQKVVRDTQSAMAVAFAHPTLTDPAVVQKAIATLLASLESADELPDWAAVAWAVKNVGKALDDAVQSGLSLDEIITAVRPTIGA
jgi:hypothetical protein